MDIKLVALSATGATVVTGIPLGYFLLRSSEVKSDLKQKNPKEEKVVLHVPEHGQNSGQLSYDNSFWWGSADKLKDKYHGKEGVWEPLKKSIKDIASTAGYSWYDNYFDLTNSNKEFVIGRSETANILSKYCKVKWNTQDSTIPDYSRIMEDLCIKK